MIAGSEYFVAGLNLIPSNCQQLSTDYNHEYRIGIQG